MYFCILQYIKEAYYSSIMNYAIIVACEIDGGIGKDNQLPWKLPEDLKNFKEVTSNAPEGKVNAVIMGRKTWESIGRALPNRINVIISNTLNINDISKWKVFRETIIVAKSLDEAHLRLKEFHNIDTIFVIGGASLYNEAIYDHRYTTLYMTVLYKSFECDTFFPVNLIKYRYKIHKKSEILTSQETDTQYKYLVFKQ
jgi:dihydrofolate reductase